MANTHKASNTHTRRFSRELFPPNEDSILGHLQKIFNLMRKIQFCYSYCLMGGKQLQITNSRETNNRMLMKNFLTMTTGILLLVKTFSNFNIPWVLFVRGLWSMQQLFERWECFLWNDSNLLFLLPITAGFFDEDTIHRVHSEWSSSGVLQHKESTASANDCE